jgi:type IV secretion system protein TrbJ
MMKTRLLSMFMASTMTTLTLAGAMLPVTPALAIPVFDASNYAENLIQAARALQQINQQIQQLQNEATMIAQMEKQLQKIDFPEIAEITQTLQKIDALMAQAQGIDFKVDALDAKFRSLFPGSAERILKSSDVLREAKARLDGAMAAFKQTMGVQAQVVENVEADARTLSAIIAKSQGAAGSLQAQQATNQLLALTTKQQFQLQTLMAAQFRSESIEAARRAQAESEARAATKRFLGTGKAYTPH